MYSIFPNFYIDKPTLLWSVKMMPHLKLQFRLTTVSIILIMILIGIAPLVKGLDDASGNFVFNGNGSFSGSPYVRSGQGTQAEPYVISDYAMGTYGIQISNSAVYVVLRNLTFSQTSTWAISLTTSSNIIISNVTTVMRNLVIYASSCQDILITNCNFSKIQSATNSFEFENDVNVLVQDSTFSEDTITGAGRFHFNNGGSIYRRPI